MELGKNGGGSSTYDGKMQDQILIVFPSLSTSLSNASTSDGSKNVLFKLLKLSFYIITGYWKPIHSF